jgi:hypothetical protein
VCLAPNCPSLWHPGSLLTASLALVNDAERSRCFTSVPSKHLRTPAQHHRLAVRQDALLPSYPGCLQSLCVHVAMKSVCCNAGEGIGPRLPRDVQPLAKTCRLCARDSALALSALSNCARSATQLMSRRCAPCHQQRLHRRRHERVYVSTPQQSSGRTRCIVKSRRKRQLRCSGLRRSCVTTRSMPHGESACWPWMTQHGAPCWVPDAARCAACTAASARHVCEQKLLMPDPSSDGRTHADAWTVHAGRRRQSCGVPRLSWLELLHLSP